MPERAFSLTMKNITRSFSMTYDQKKTNWKLFLKTNILAITVNPSARIILAPFPIAIFRESLEYSFIIFSFRARGSFPEIFWGQLAIHSPEYYNIMGTKFKH